MQADARSTLERALAAWSVAGESPGTAHTRLQHEQLIASSFDPVDCTNTPTGKFQVASRGLRVRDAVYFVVVDDLDPATPNLATMIREDGRWALKALKFQCLSCFGTGVIGITPCDVCGATGWGLQEAEWLE
jgi:hypothetical protein